jgi:hypothetical protein
LPAPPRPLTYERKKERKNRMEKEKKEIIYIYICLVIPAFIFENKQFARNEMEKELKKKIIKIIRSRLDCRMSILLEKRIVITRNKREK